MRLVAHSLTWNRICQSVAVLGVFFGVATLVITYFVINEFRTELLAKLPPERVPAFDEALRIEEILQLFIMSIIIGVLVLNLSAVIMMRRNLGGKTS